MPTRWLLFVAITCVFTAAQQESEPPAVRAATVTAVTHDALDTRSCTGDKEFRSSITSPFIFNGKLIQEGAQFVGHVQACNRDFSGKHLRIAAVAIEAIVLQNGRVTPIFAFLQALGPPLPPARVTPTGSDRGYVPKMEFHQGVETPSAALQEADVTDVTRRGATDVDALSNVSTGVVGLKNIDFNNTGAGKSVLWVFSSDTDIEIEGGSQIVVRFGIAPSSQQP